MRRPGIRRLFRFSRRSRGGVREDVHEEFTFHIQMRTEELVRSGLTDREGARSSVARVRRCRSGRRSLCQA